MIKNYIFDFGNVITHFCPEMLTAVYISDEKMIKYLSDIVFDRLYWNELDRGTITDEKVKELIKSRVPEELKEISCVIYDNWIKNLTPIKGMQTLVRDIHKSGKKLYLLSNISREFKDAYPDVEWINELFGYFDGLVFSGNIGLVKPDKDIFDYLIDKYNLERNECLFIDDSEKNIEGAKKAGIKGYLFDGNADKLRKYIQM